VTLRASVDESGIRPLPSLSAAERAGSERVVPEQALSPASSLEPQQSWVARPVLRLWLGATALLIVGAVVGASVLWWATETTKTLPVAGVPTETRAAVVPAPMDVPSAPARAQVMLASEPAGAEVVVRGAVIGNTPMRVPGTAHEALYLLRHRGYHAQLVRVSAQSGEVVVAVLRPLVEESPESMGQPQARTSTQPVSAKPRGNDVSKQ